MHMQNSVLIAGLSRADYAGMDRQTFAEWGEVWTCNDWYVFLPWLNPTQVWNIHDADKHVHPSPDRYLWDWKSWYNDVIEHGGKIIIRERIDGVNADGQHFLDMDTFTAKTPAQAWACTISIQIAWAAVFGYKRIGVIGAMFNNAEYDYQPKSCLAAVNFARELGADVRIMPDARESQWGVLAMHYDGGITPYWLR